MGVIHIYSVAMATLKFACLGGLDIICIYRRYIDFVEFMVIFYIMAEGSAEEVYILQSFINFELFECFLQVLGKIFRVFDVNSDGTISNKEMKRLVKASKL